MTMKPAVLDIQFIYLKIFFYSITAFFSQPVKLVISWKISIDIVPFAKARGTFRLP